MPEFAPLCKMAGPSLTSRKFQASQAGLWIVSKHYPDRSICRVRGRTRRFSEYDVQPTWLGK